jgi:hypothetical protein
VQCCLSSLIGDLIGTGDHPQVGDSKMQTHSKLARSSLVKLLAALRTQKLSRANASDQRVYQLL